MKRFIASGLILAVCSLCLGLGQAQAGPVLDRVRQAGMLRVGITTDNPPLTFISRQGEPMGYEVDLARLAAAAMGVKLELTTMHFDQLMPALNAGEVDIVIGAVTMTPQRNASFMLVGPYLVTGQSILTTQRLLGQMQEEFDHQAPELVIAASRGTTSAETVKELFPKARLVEVSDQEAGLKALLERQVDALVADHNFCVVATLRFRQQGLATLDKPFTMEPLGVVFTEDALLYNWVENFLLIMRNTGRSDVLKKKWLESPAWLAELPPDKVL
ncbi:MAG: transporter substrate-binding domain-containing protein [Pseudomonadota bacterium]